jgi:hypothetical protein
MHLTVKTFGFLTIRLNIHLMIITRSRDIFLLIEWQSIGEIGE